MELFALPDTYDVAYHEASCLKGIQTVIHAPHIKQGFDPSNKNAFTHNLALLGDSFRFADMFDASIIITHPGVRGAHSLEENLRQFHGFNDKRLTVENLPYSCVATHHDLDGAYPKEIKRFIDELSCQFCLDFSHSVCTANRVGLEVYDILDEFSSFHPVMYHLCDGDIKSPDDNHLHYGEGNYDLKRFIREYTTKDALITMETGFGLPSSLQPWLDDLAYIKRFDE